MAPRHRQLEPLVAYLNNLKVPIQYEKRENILESVVLTQLITMAELVLALSRGDNNLAESYWPEILSYDFWEIPTELIWQMSLGVNKHYDSKRLTWSEAILGDNFGIRRIGLFFLELAKKSRVESLEIMLDLLIGSEQLRTTDKKFSNVSSPLKDFYTSTAMQTTEPELFYEFISNLVVVRKKITQFAQAEDKLLNLDFDFVTFVDLYRTTKTHS